MAVSLGCIVPVHVSDVLPSPRSKKGYSCGCYARRKGQSTQSNKLYRKVKHRARPTLSSPQRPKRAPISCSRRWQRRGEPHTEHGLGVQFVGVFLRYLYTSLMLRSQSSSGEPTACDSRELLATAALIPPGGGGGGGIE